MAALVCDPQVGIIQYKIEINGTVLAPFPANADGSARYELDASFVPGTYTFRLSPMGQGNWEGDFSPPFVATKPASSVGLRIVS